MKITRKNLDEAVEEQILSSEQAERLAEFIKNHPSTGPSFDFTHVLYYLGGLIAIGAMTIFMNLGWESFGGTGILLIALVYAGIGLKLTNILDSKRFPGTGRDMRDICSRHNAAGDLRASAFLRLMAR